MIPFTNLLKKWGATMTEYIERETVIKALKDNVTEMESYIYFGSNLGVPEDEIEDIVNEIPAADVEPVKHGKWTSNGDDWECYKCSICRNEAYWDADYGQQLFDFCPWCGAKMDGKEVQE